MRYGVGWQAESSKTISTPDKLSIVPIGRILDLISLVLLPIFLKSSSSSSLNVSVLNVYDFRNSGGLIT